MSRFTKFFIVISIFCVINLIYSFGVSYTFTSNLKDFVETFIIMNLVFYLQLSALPIAVKHEKILLLFKKTGDPKIRKHSVKSSILLLAVVFTLMVVGIFIAGFTTPERYRPPLDFLKMISVIIALFGMLVGGPILQREIEKVSR